MGNLLTRELKRDWIHLSEHSDFKNALKATSDLLEAYAKAEKLRVEREQRKMKTRDPKRERNGRRGEGAQQTMGLPNEQHGRRKRRHTRHREARGEIPYDAPGRPPPHNLRERTFEPYDDRDFAPIGQGAQRMRSSGYPHDLYADAPPVFERHASGPRREHANRPIFGPRRRKSSMPNHYAGIDGSMEDEVGSEDHFSPRQAPRRFSGQGRRPKQSNHRMPDRGSPSRSHGGRSMGEGSRTRQSPVFDPIDPDGPDPEYMGPPRRRREVSKGSG